MRGWCLWFGSLAAALLIAPGAVREAARAEAEEPKEKAPVVAAITLPMADASGRYDPERVWLDPSSAEQRMRAALDEGDREQARAIGEAALWSSDPTARGRLLWLLARSEATPEASEARLVSLRKSDHPLARWAALRAAESMMWQKPAQAIALVNDLTRGWPGAREARILLARSEHMRGDDKRAEPLLRALLSESSPQAAVPTIALPLADILTERATAESLREALALYRRVGARAAGTDPGTQADKLAARVFALLPKKWQWALAQPNTEDELARAQTLNAKNHFADAQKVLDKLAKRLPANSSERCKAELEAGKALFNRREREEAAKRLGALPKHCKDPEVKAWAHYFAASSHQRTGNPKAAIAEYEALVREAPLHSLADDALLLEANAQEDAGDSSAAEDTLRRLLERYPHGDMHEQARFALAFAARARGDHRAALEQLEHIMTEESTEHGEGLEGRAAYWRARTLEALARPAEAVGLYVELARMHPLSYHAQQALARLEKLDPESRDMLLDELADIDAVSSPLNFAWRPELDAPGFRSAIELLRVGEIELARRELSSLGALGESADENMLWLTAATLDAAHAYSEASQLVRSRLASFRKTIPRGRARLLWKLAYPEAYSPLIEQAATEMRVPAELVRAIAREESDFNPEAVSSALAYGLIQLIVPTARIHGRALGLPSDPNSLKRPEINLRIGSHFIADLWQRYPSNRAVLPAAYNAGFVAVDRWLREAPSGEELDEWIERIPYRETRRYTRRVLQSYGTYAWLETGRLPALPSSLPVAPGSSVAAPPAPEPTSQLP